MSFDRGCREGETIPRLNIPLVVLRLAQHGDQNGDHDNRTYCIPAVRQVQNSKGALNHR